MPSNPPGTGARGRCLENAQGRGWAPSRPRPTLCRRGPHSRAVYCRGGGHAASAFSLYVRGDVGGWLDASDLPPALFYMTHTEARRLAQEIAMALRVLRRYLRDNPGEVPILTQGGVTLVPRALSASYPRYG
jgi:hypothetical protein